jgi:hypothetical protein
MISLDILGGQIRHFYLNITSPTVEMYLFITKNKELYFFIVLFFYGF